MALKSYRRAITFIEKDHLSDWSSEKDYCLQLTFRQPVLQARQIENVSVRHLLTEKEHWNVEIIECNTFNGKFQNFV